MSYWETLQEQFPVRKRREQKEAFRQWAVPEAERLGYAARVEPTGGFSRNVVVGDPETAEVVFTAHYDTPPRMLLPNIVIPRNLPLFYAYQIGFVLMLVTVAAVVGVAAALLGVKGRAIFWIAWLVYMGFLMLMLVGPANPHNANDNTSGVATLFELMARLPEDARGRAAFILFDNEEKGLLGSKAYAKAHPEVKCLRLVVNLDCVGNGETFLVIASKLAAQLPAYAALEEALRRQPGRDVCFYGTRGSAYNSDQKSFSCGVAVAACKRRRGIGWYCDRLHTPKDTVCDQENLTFLADALCAWVKDLAGQAKQEEA